MRRDVLLPAAYAFDGLAGDPEWLPHPVRLMGLAIARGEKALRRQGQSDRAELVLGGLLTGAVVGGAYFACKGMLAIAKKQSIVAGDIVELLMAWTCLAGRNLQDEAGTVLNALQDGDLLCARLRLARIVGRDTARLNEAEISRALIETLAESASDGIIAPMFYLALGGVPLAMAYKAVNTLDSMIGHADERYFYFGKVAARLDDVANFVPARLTAGLMILTAAGLKGCNAGGALQVWRHDAHKHKSPNAGQPESAMAGALRVQLGGQNFYAGQPLDAPLLGAGHSAPTPAKAQTAARLVSVCALLALALATAYAACARRR